MTCEGYEGCGWYVYMRLKCVCFQQNPDNKTLESVGGSTQLHAKVGKKTFLVLFIKEKKRCPYYLYDSITSRKAAAPTRLIESTRLDSTWPGPARPAPPRPDLTRPDPTQPGPARPDRLKNPNPTRRVAGSTNRPTPKYEDPVWQRPHLAPCVGPSVGLM